jgi:outer membrane protein assembly factor BamD
MSVLKTKYLILLAFFISHCVSYDKFDTSTAKGSYDLARQLEEDERFEEALLQYRDVKNRFPYSQYAVSSELQVAEIHFKKECFIEAQGAYQLFKELHPKHPKIDYVTFRIGESIFMQLPSTVDRDLSMAPAAIKEFEVLMRDYPQSTFLQDAKDKRRETLDMLAEKELYIADFYFRTDEWTPAVTRYEQYIRLYPGHQKQPHAHYRAGLAAEKAGNNSKRKALFRALIEQYPKSREAKKAKGIF